MAQDLFDISSTQQPQGNDLFEGNDLLGNAPATTQKQPYTGFGSPEPGSLEYQRMTGEINPLSYAMQKTGQAGQTVGNAVYNAATAIPRGITKLATLGDPTTPEDMIPFTNAANAVGNYASGAIQKGGNYINNLGVGKDYTGPSMAQFAQQDYNAIPEEGRKDIESIPGMLAMGIPDGGIAKALSVTPNETPPNIIQKFAKKATTPIEEHASNFWNNRPSPDNANRIAQEKYDLADKAGAALSVQSNDDFSQNALKSVMGGEGKYKFSPTGAVKDVLEEINKHQGTPLALKDAQQLEEFINGRITYQPNGFLTPESNDLLKIKRTLRNTINGAKPEDLVSGANGWSEWNDAKKAYSARGILTDINNIINKSINTDQPANALKRNTARWSLKPTTKSGLEDTEMDLVKDSIRDNFAKEIMRAGGSRLAPIGATALGMGTGHGFLGAVTGTAASMGVRNAAFANQLAKVGDIADAVGQRLPSLRGNLYERFEDVPEHVLNPLQIPPKEKMSLLPMTDEQIAHAQAVMNRTGNPVTTPYSGAPVSPTMQKFLPSPQTAGRLPAEGGTEAEIAHARARLAATPQVSSPYSGAPLAPSVNSAGSLTNPMGQEGYAMSIDDLYGNNPNEPDIGAYNFPKKKSGGAVKGKIGFKLKKTKK